MRSLVKNTAALFVLLLMLMKTLSMPLALLNYKANKKYIAEKLCVNKSRPMMHCDGQCFLKKQLENSSETSTVPEKSSGKTITVDFFEEMKDFEPSPITSSHNSSFAIYSSGPLYQFSPAVFHPPCNPSI